MPWSSKTFEPSDIPGHIGPRTNAKIFELMLRLRANTYWPAMHECSVAFFMTDGNREVAERYGIYIGARIVSLWHAMPPVNGRAVAQGITIM